VFAGGGTGGHLFPGLATADALKSLLGDVRITFAGSGAAFERRHASTAGYEYLTLRSRPLRTKPWAWPGFLAAHWQGRRQAFDFLRKHPVDLVVGLGGYASVPMASAAAARGIPLVLLEQNAVPGRANRWLARRATRICLGFKAASRHFPQVAPDRLLVTGTPLRAIQGNSEPTTSSKPLLVVCGGSGGARPLNLSVPQALARLKDQLDAWRVVHQTGENGLAMTRALYEQLGIEAEVVSFVPELPRVLAQASLAICRAGGTTLAELAASGTPAILCPYPFAADDHQLRNAEVFAATGASVLVNTRPLESEAGIAELTGAVAKLLGDADQRKALSDAAQAMARPRAAVDVAEIIASSLSLPVHAACIDAESLRGV
jgi:UDP-N-acetylglucosamine--N-acetylmuramyl-(pentapeptide) pyrophosphoryl-undecaprenol N-acetylglucosamine transferase